VAEFEHDREDFLHHATEQDVQPEINS
jgi:hypothetical protein